MVNGSTSSPRSSAFIAINLPFPIYRLPLSHGLLLTYLISATYSTHIQLQDKVQRERERERDMVFPIVLLRLADWVLYQLLANSCYRAARKIRNYGRHPSFKSHHGSMYPSVSKCPLDSGATKTVVCDIHGTLLRTQSFFPYFMLVAFEGGGILRALLLLMASPILWVLNHELRLRVMVFVTFCGLRLKDMECVGRAVLPKFYLENLHLQAYEVLASTSRRLVFTSVPRVMVEGFLKEYLRVDDVVGTKLHVVGGYFTGLLTDSKVLVKHEAITKIFGESKPDIGLGGCGLHDHLFISLSKVWILSYKCRQEAQMKASLL